MQPQYVAHTVPVLRRGNLQRFHDWIMSHASDHRVPNCDDENELVYEFSGLYYRVSRCLVPVAYRGLISYAPRVQTKPNETMNVRLGS